jgi:hypothetical protein
MIRRNTWIALGAFGLLVMAALIVNRSATVEPEDASTQSPEPIWRLESSDIVGLIVEDLRQQTLIELARDEEQLWRLVGPEQVPADAGRVERAVSWLASPAPRAELFDTLDLAAFELDEPHFRIEILTGDGSRLSLDIGREAPTGGSRYAMTEGRLGVLLLSTAGLDEVLELESDLLATPTPEATPELTELAPEESGNDEEGGN